MDRSVMTAGLEWRRFWPLAVASAIGYSMTSIHVYTLGAFMEPLEQEFGWTRSQISVGLTISGLIGAALAIPVGLLVDRLGPRIIGLTGIMLLSSAYALFGTATGTTANWIMLWVFFALVNALMSATVWTKGVASCFERGRGSAFALTLCGSAIGATVSPLVVTWLIGTVGWRMAFPALAGMCAALIFPVAFRYFRIPKANRKLEERPQSDASLTIEGVSLLEALRIASFYKLLAASGLFVFTVTGTVVHFIPLLTDFGANPMAAAGTASIIGLFAILGRLCTGPLLDLFRANFVGAAVFLLPILATTLLLFAGDSPVIQVIAAVCFGFTLGSEVDVIAYLTSRYLGIRHYGALFGAMGGALALGSASGPLAAGAAYDIFGNYEPFMVATLVASFVSLIALATLGRPKF